VDRHSIHRVRANFCDGSAATKTPAKANCLDHFFSYPFLLTPWPRREKPHSSKPVGVKVAHATGMKKAEAVSLGLKQAQEFSGAA
jgi:hypothetical protein